jgi:hypothetical protein
MDKINNAYIDLYALYEGEPLLYGDYLRTDAGETYEPHRRGRGRRQG